MAYARRLGRFTKKLTGKELKSQMLRTLFISWFDEKDPPVEDRKVVADWMQHSVERQMGTYTKRPPPERREIDHAQKKSSSTEAAAASTISNKYAQPQPGARRVGWDEM